MQKFNAIICDIDGTLSERGDRSPYNWSKVESDTVHKHIADMLSLYFSHTDIILVSGRDSVCYGDTLRWLNKNRIKFDGLYMRAVGDKRRDSIVKQEIYENHIKDKYNILFVLDDRDQVVKMWRSLGLKCLQVAEGNF